MRVLLDIDGVLCSFVEALVTEPPSSWDFLTEEHERVIKKPGFVLSLKPYPQALRHVAALRLKHDVHFVTAPCDASLTWCHERRTWLEQHLRAFSDEVTFTHAKYLVQGDVFVDDNPEQVASWKAANRGLALLWDQPWNRHDTELTRCLSWPHLHQLMAVDSANVR